MEHKILSGSYFAEIINNQSKTIVDDLLTKNKRIPSLTIIQTNKNKASDLYIKNKIKTAKSIGIIVNKLILEASTTEQLTDEINKLNNDLSIDGILLQLPLNENIDKNLVFNVIDPNKDVDCFNRTNVGDFYLDSKHNNLISPTIKAIIELLKFNEIEIESKNVVIINRSNLIGKPLANLFLRENATVTICHSKTKDLKSITKNADILITAVSKPNFIDSSYLKKNSIIIDVSINEFENKICGDVNFKDVINIVQYITPVPKGIGPLTVAFLFKNLLDLYKKNN